MSQLFFVHLLQIVRDCTNISVSTITMDKSDISSKENDSHLCNKNRRKSKLKPDKVQKIQVCPKHEFSDTEIKTMRSNLLAWFDGNARVLPWRSAADPNSSNYVTDHDTRGYMVWVSEVMLQQTQVSTVIEYFK